MLDSCLGLSVVVRNHCVFCYIVYCFISFSVSVYILCLPLCDMFFIVYAYYLFAKWSLVNSYVLLRMLLLWRSLLHCFHICSIYCYIFLTIFK